MKIVITPIGTSLLSNYIDEFLAKKDSREINQTIKEVYNDVRDKQRIEQDDLDDIKNDLQEYLENYLNSCAEKTSIKKIKQEFNDNIKTILIVSETQISNFLGEIFKEYFGENCEIKEIKGLQIEDKHRFENEGLYNFIEFFKTLNKKELIFNITAGYKAFIPYLTIIGQIYNIPIKYIFEESDNLISIPQLPIGFDDKIADLYLPYLDKDGLKLLNSNNDIKNKLEEYGFIKDNIKISLTPLGELFKSYMEYKKTYLGIIIEFLITNLFIKNNKFPKKGETYNYTENNQDKIGEIDLIIENDNEIEFFEIKSLGAYKQKQLKRHIEFIDNDNSSKSKTLTILFYLLDIQLLNSKKPSFKQIKQYNENIDFKVKYIEIEPNKFQNFVREFENRQIKEFNYE